VSSRLVRALLAAPALALTAAPAATIARAQPAPSVPFDAYIASGDASCLELTVNIAGYSFVVTPDVRMPRATSTVSEGQAAALAAPIDPGDSVDALSGLVVPREEGQLASGLDSGSAQVSLPLPAAPGTTVVEALNPYNPSLEYPIEHASATYPNPRSSGPQQANYLGANNLAVSDPTGLFSLDGTAGTAKADAQSAAADAGAGSAVSVAPIGFNVGRLAVHAQSAVGQTSVTSDVSCALGDVTVAPPGAGYSFHIGALDASLHTEKTLAGQKATARPSLHLSGITVTQTSGGHTTTTDLSPAGNTVSVPGPLSYVALPQPPALPAGTAVPSVQSLALAGTSTASVLSSRDNEMTSTLSAATLTMQTILPVPTTVPTGPPPCLTEPQQLAQCLPSLVPVPSGGGPPVTTAPATFTVQLAHLDSTAYGFNAAALGPLPANGSGGGGPVGSPAVGGPVGASGGSPGSAGTKPVSATVNVAGTPGFIRWPVVALAALLEALLLTALFFRRRAALRARPGPPPDSFVDMP
jgi:hypothetical protein